MENISRVNKFIANERAQLLNHPVYKKIKHIDDLKAFTEVHIFAVWDFMSLLKALQVKLTCVDIPWMPTGSPTTRHLINEIVLAEESDEFIDGRRLSHFEMYIEAMREMGANTDTMDKFLAELASSRSVEQAAKALQLDPRVQAFLEFTFASIAEGEAHKIASAFTFGREDLIPDMFTSILAELRANFPDTEISMFDYYFQRHIDLDGDEHGPLAMRMIMELGGDDETKWREMAESAKKALEVRIQLWDAIEDSLKKD